MAVWRHLWGLLVPLSSLTEIKFSGQTAHRTQSDKTVFLLKFHPRTSAHLLRGYFKTEVRIFGSYHSFLFAPLNVSRDGRKAARHFCHIGWTVTTNTPRLYPYVYFNEVFTSNLEKGSANGQPWGYFSINWLVRVPSFDLVWICTAQEKLSLPLTPLKLGGHWHIGLYSNPYFIISKYNGIYIYHRSWSIPNLALLNLIYWNFR